MRCRGSDGYWGGMEDVPADTLADDDSKFLEVAGIRVRGACVKRGTRYMCV